MSKVILIKAQTRQVTAVKYFTLRADRNQDGEESLVNLSNVDSADVPRVIHQICFSFLRLLPCVWVFIKKSFQPTKKPKHLHLLLPPSKKKIQRVYLQLFFSLCSVLSLPGGDVVPGTTALFQVLADQLELGRTSWKCSAEILITECLAELWVFILWSQW